MTVQLPNFNVNLDRIDVVCYWIPRLYPRFSCYTTQFLSRSYYHVVLLW